jgi:hypothetical protein
MKTEVVRKKNEVVQHIKILKGKIFFIVNSIPQLFISMPRRMNNSHLLEASF